MIFGCHVIQVVSHIMRFLDLPDRKSAALVCRRWYYASLDPLVTSNDVMTFHTWSQLHSALPLLSNRSRLNLVLERIYDSVARVRLASEIFPRVRSLSVADCQMSASLFTSLLSRCTALEKLNISRCNDLFMLSKPADVELLTVSFSRLRELKIASVRYVSDETFSRLMSVCPSLESLSLADNRIVFDTKHLQSLRSGKASRFLTFDSIMGFLKNNASQITALDFSRTEIDDEALSSLAQIPNLSLTELCVGFCDEVTDKGVAALCKAQPSLKLLDLTDCKSVTDASLESVCSACENIRVLRLGECRRVTDLSVCKLKSQHGLRQLDLNATYSVTSRGLSLGLCSTTSPLTYLTSLNLKCCSSVSDSFIVEMTCCIPRLLDLDISSCSIGNASLRAISARLTSLRRLRLARDVAGTYRFRPSRNS